MREMFFVTRNSRYRILDRGPPWPWLLERVAALHGSMDPSGVVVGERFTMQPQTIVPGIVVYFAGRANDQTSPVATVEEWRQVLQPPMRPIIKDEFDRAVTKPTLPTVGPIPIETAIAAWHGAQGGHFARPAGHALRLLREAVELCFAAGSYPVEIATAVEAEIAKATEKREIHPDVVDVGALAGECGDVGILLDLFCHYAKIDLLTSKCRKLDVAMSRAQRVDADGVLWRIR